MKLFWTGIAIAIIIIALAIYCLITKPPEDHRIEFGASFSKVYAEELGIDWKEAYLATLDDLEIKSVRLIAYWTEIEPKKGEFDFKDLDWQMEEARNRNIDVTLTIGYKLPRWPECFIPNWVDTSDKTVIEESLLEMEKKVINRYKGYPNLKRWQIENEPLVGWFGHCPEPNKNLLGKEIDLVHSLSDKPILITDSGELSTWLRTSRLGDIFGTTLYRKVYNRYIGYWDYWFIPACFYRLKANLVGLSTNDVIISELQAEPWFPHGFPAPLEEQYKSMDAEQLRSNLEYANRTGFPEAYIWGIEWWYWLKLQGDESIWETGKEIINQ